MTVVGVDFKGSLALARGSDQRIRWVDCNLGLWSDLAEAAATLALGCPRLLIASDVVEHLSDPRPLLGTLRRLLLDSPRSRLIISTPDRYRIHGHGMDILPANRCHAREWRLQELELALAASGFVVERRGYTRSNLEDEALGTLFLELSASSLVYADFRRQLELGHAALSEAGLTLSGRTNDWEILQQALFWVPDLPAVMTTQESQDVLASAAAAGLLPRSLRINGVPFVPPPSAGPVDVSVVVLATDQSIEALQETIVSINSQSVDPDETVLLTLGSKLDYRLLLRERLRGLSRRPLRWNNLTGADGEKWVARAEEWLSTNNVAVVEGGDVLFNDFLESATRLLSHMPDVDRVTLLAHPSSDPESLPSAERAPFVARRACLESSRDESTRELPTFGWLRRRCPTEPAQGVTRALLQCGWSGLRRLLRD
jgi:hypothetical protein